MRSLGHPYFTHLLKSWGLVIEGVETYPTSYIPSILVLYFLKYCVALDRELTLKMVVCRVALLWRSFLVCVYFLSMNHFFDKCLPLTDFVMNSLSCFALVYNLRDIKHQSHPEPGSFTPSLLIDVWADVVWIWTAASMRIAALGVEKQ